MKKTIYLLAITAMIFTACYNQGSKDKTGNHTGVHSEDKHSHDHSTSKTDDENQMLKATNEGEKTKGLTLIIDSYLQLKNALVEDDSKKAANAGEILLDAFSNFDMAKLTEEQHKEYMEIIENAKEQAEHIVKSPIDHQREHFEVLSNDVNDLITLVGTDKHLYQDFCPMYNNGKGAIWLSETKEIKNPYYGNKMLNCGKVQKEI